MKKPVVFSLLVLSLALGACGKKDNAAVVETGAVIQPMPVNPVYPLPTGQTGLTLQQYCQYYSSYPYQSTLSGTTCAVTETFNSGNTGGYSFTFTFGSSGPYNTGVPISVGERVTVTSSGSLSLYVYNGGYTSVGSGNSSFVANVNGTLVYTVSSGFNSNAGIQSVAVTSCVNSAIQPVTCP